MTQEEKSKAYDEAREKIALRFGSNVANEIFSQFEMSDDERVRKEMLVFFKNFSENGTWKAIPDVTKWIAWLEKQGGTNEIINRDKFAQGVLRGAAIHLITWIDYNAAEGNMCLSNMECKDIEDALVSNDWDKVYSYMKKKLEKQGEQKPANKVEPKFKVGDWIASDVAHSDYRICKIIKIENGYYTIESTYGYKGYNIFEEFDNIYHLWTIEDAKDGDVLAVEAIEEKYQYPFVAIYKERGLDFFNSYCFIGFDGKFYGADTGHSIKEIHPATKEQRDTLMKAMTDAGYTFDFEKKELKKFERKPIWNEEDERLFQIVIDILDKQNHLGNISRTDLIACVRKLKSFRPQKHWKPSNEQLDALHDAAVYVDKSMFPYPKGILMKLYEQLKKL